MKEWLLSLSAIIILTAVVNYLLPSGRTSELLKTLFSLVITLVVILPVVNFISPSSIDGVFDGEIEVSSQYDYLISVRERREGLLKESCENALKEIGLTDFNVKIEFSENSLLSFDINPQKIYVYIKKSVINSDEPDIDISVKIKDAVSYGANIDREKIEILYKK